MLNIIKIVVLSMLFVASSQAALYENWAGGEPNDNGLGEDCAIIKSDGKWNDSGCSVLFTTSDNRHFACYDGATWALTAEAANLVNGKMHEECQKLGVKFYFAAPFNNYENERLRFLVEDAGITDAWINVQDQENEGAWVSNGTWDDAVMAPYVTRWAGQNADSIEPDNGGSGGDQDCTVMAKDGFWHDTECDAGEYRFLCADPGFTWHLSTVTSTNENLYSGERACRSSDIAHSFKIPVTDPEYDGTRAAVLASVGSDELIWVNLNDQLDEGEFKANENRYFWNDGEPNLIGTEECVVKTASPSAPTAEHGWNNVTCAASRNYACYRHADGSWLTAAGVLSDYNLEEGIAACKTLDSASHTYTFWAPVTYAQNNSVPVGAWFNAQQDTSTLLWELNQDSAFWGWTTLWDKDGDFNNTNYRNVSEPNNGIFDAHAGESPYLNVVAGQEHCASQQPGGYWFDVSCSFAMPVACFDSTSSTEPWKLAPAQVNKDLYSGERACLSLSDAHNYRFLAPATRQQQLELSNLAGLSAVWVNASDRIAEKDWLYSDFLLGWAGTDSGLEQPVSDESLDCAIANGSAWGVWEARDCSESHEVLCKNDANWSLSGSLISLTDSIVSGQNACKALAGGPWVFAATKNLVEYVDSLPLLVGKEVWINAFDTEVEGDWKINHQRFWDLNEPDVTNSASEDCALMNESNGLWKSNECNSGISYSYLCFDIKNDVWKVSTNSGNLNNFPEGQNACEAMNTYTEEFVFAAPSYEWDNVKAKAAITSVGASPVWINANDRIEEGNWIFNQFLYWSASALNDSPDIKDCLTMNNLGYWQDTVCDSSVATNVACYSGDNWYLAPISSDLSNFSEGQRACDELGEGYLFFAPTTNEHNRNLRTLISGGESVWINGIDIAEEGKWVLNSAGSPTPNWASFEPNGGIDENCAYVDQQGLWFDDACSGNSAARPVACRDALTGELSISLSTIELDSDNNFDNAHSICGIDKRFSAPVTFNENEKLIGLIAQYGIGGEEIWVDVSDALFETRWALNIAATADYSLSGDTGSDACGSLDNTGLVVAADCSLQKVVTCYDGQDWRVTNAKTALGNASNNGKLIRNAFAICQQEFSGDFTFAVPEVNDESGKWQLAQALALRGAVDAWLNVADWFVADQFSFNMPYQNISISASAITGCAYVDGSNSGWLVAEQCDTKAAHFACYDGSTWNVAPANGTIAEPGTPQLGIDAWDQSYGDLRCKQFFGESYNFTAPITPKEDARLQLLVSRLGNSNKDTWINYYANRLWTLNGQQWFSDRINTNIVDGTNIDQGRTTEDCGLISKASGKLNLTDEVCSEQQRVLCFNGTEWKRTVAAVQWNQASAQCGTEFDEAHMFAIPRDGLERSLVDSLLSNDGDVTWVNYSDLAVESKWRANLPVRQWWSINEPSNLGNRDCAVIDAATSTWRADYCDQVFYQYTCKNGTQWKIVGTDGSEAINAPAGIWAQGFSACSKLSAAIPGNWSFEYPEDYFSNLAAATSFSANTDLQTELAAGKSAWLNLTDQYREKNWQRGRQFSDWAADFGFDDSKNCAYVYTESATLPNGDTVKGSWVPESCISNISSFACSDGKNWQVAIMVTPVGVWADGFAECQALGADWVYAAPNTSFDNERLKSAIGKGSAWINLQDMSIDGDWAANFPDPN